MKAFFLQLTELFRKLLSMYIEEKPAVFSEAGVTALRMVMAACVLLFFVLLVQFILSLAAEKTRSAIACGITCLVLLAANLLFYLPQRAVPAAEIQAITVRPVTAQEMREEDARKEKQKTHTSSSDAASQSASGTDAASQSASEEDAAAQSADAASDASQTAAAEADAEAKTDASQTESAAQDALVLTTAQKQAIVSLLSKQICSRTPLRMLPPTDGYLITLELADGTCYSVLAGKNAAYRYGAAEETGLLCVLYQPSNCYEQLVAALQSAA